MKQEATAMENLHQETWEIVSLQLLTKMIREFMYEEIISPVEMEKQADGVYFYRLPLDSGISYTFKAKKRLFNSYHIIAESIKRHQETVSLRATNPIRFLLDIQNSVGIAPITLSHLIREYNQTLLADAHILQRKKDKLVDLTEMDYTELEGEMEGHPWITYNKGRIGFSYPDYLAYAPEQKKEVQINWIAVRKERAQFHSVNHSYETFIRDELGEKLTLHFIEKLQVQGANPEEYFFLPVHEWQWNEYIISFFAEDLYNKGIIYLGKGTDWYVPQQSIRTFVNKTHRHKHHVKLPMSILNTLVYRGLPGERTVLAPQITAFIQNIWQNDAFLKDEHRVVLPGEIASLNVDHSYYHHMEGAPYQYLEMLGSIWRESVYTFLDPGEKPITLAALLHKDGQGKPFIQSLIEKSPLDTKEWLAQLFEVILPPLLHFLYQYGVVFSPHGQNTILILKDHMPHRLAIKDFVDDVNVSKHPLPELQSLSDELKEVLRSEPPEGLCQFIFTGLFIGHFRYLSDLLAEDQQYSEEYFWQQVRSTIVNYQERFSQNKERYKLFDLLKPSFTKLCLNRNRILDYGYGDDGDRPHASEYGEISNALAIVDEK